MAVPGDACRPVLRECLRPGGDQVRPRRRTRFAVRGLRRGIRQASQREARCEGQSSGFRIEPTRRRQGTAAEAQAGHRRHGAALDGDVLGGGPVRRLRDALPREGPQAHGAHRKGGLLVEARAGGREERAENPRGPRSEADLFGVFEMPYLVKDRKHMGRIEKEVFWSKLAPEAEKKGLKILAVRDRRRTCSASSRCPTS